MTITNPKTITEERKAFQVISEGRLYFMSGHTWYGEADTLEQAEKIARKNRDGRDYPIICKKEGVTFSQDKYDDGFSVNPLPDAPYWYYDRQYKEWCEA